MYYESVEHYNSLTVLFVPKQTFIYWQPYRVPEQDT
jgi:hypothetical protein